MRSIVIAIALLAAAHPVAAQLPPAPTPVPGGLLDEPRAEAKPRREHDAGRQRKAKGLPAASWKAERPDWLRVDPTVIASFTGENVIRTAKPPQKQTTTLRDGVATRSLDYPGLTWWSRVKPIPAQREACATVFLKLHEDFRPGNGGKLPGFSNTGLGRRHTAAPEVVNGRKMPNTGWGGRRPDGVHWSARSGFGDWDDQGAALRTYFYALSPKNLWGHIDAVGTLPKGRWTAYVQCVKLNTPGQDDGGLYYEIVGDGHAIYARDGIRWRDEDVPEALIDEFWLDFYCGGMKCGDGPRGTISFAKAVITRGLPDMGTVRAELARLERVG